MRTERWIFGLFSGIFFGLFSLVSLSSPAHAVFEQETRLRAFLVCETSAASDSNYQVILSEVSSSHHRQADIQLSGPGGAKLIQKFMIKKTPDGTYVDLLTHGRNFSLTLREDSTHRGAQEAELMLDTRQGRIQSELSCKRVYHMLSLENS